MSMEESFNEEKGDSWTQSMHADIAGKSNCNTAQRKNKSPISMETDYE
jgi:hypothetical protein